MVRKRLDIINGYKRDVLKALLKERYLLGDGTGVLGKRFELRSAFVATLLKEAGVTLRTEDKRKPANFSDEAIKDMITSYTGGESLNSVSRRHNSTYSTVKALLKANGVTVRTHRQASALSKQDPV